MGKTVQRDVYSVAPLTGAASSGGGVARLALLWALA
jgi:hypothetical protein